MNEIEETNMVKGLFAKTADAIRNMINKAVIVDYGIIKGFPNGEYDGYVDVAISVAKSKNEVQLRTCVLANIASKNISINIKPEVGDKVIVLTPRTFDDDMFDNDNSDFIINPYATGYDIFSGIALPVKQFLPEKDFNIMDFEDGGMTLNLAYDTEKEDNLFKLNVTKDGSLSLTSTNGEDGKQVQLDIESKGNVSLTAQNTSLSIQDDVITIDNGGANITIGSDGKVTIDAKNGKISLKNTAGGSLFSILDSMITTLNTNLATQGSPAAHTVIPGQFTTEKTSLGNLME